LLRVRGLAELGFVLALGGCSRTPSQGTVPSAKDAGIAIPSLDGLGLTKVVPPDDGPDDAAKWLRKTTVNVPAKGKPQVVGTSLASRWVGAGGPWPEGSFVASSLPPPKPWARVTVTDEGRIAISRIQCGSVIDFVGKLAALTKRKAFSRVAVFPDASVPFGKVLPVVAVLVEQGVDFWLVSRRVQEKPASEVLECLKREAEAASRNSDNLPNVSLTIRADASASWDAVYDVTDDGMRHYYWRLTFVGLLDGREVELGEVRASPEDPPMLRELLRWKEVEIEEGRTSSGEPQFVVTEAAPSAGVPGELGIGKRGAGR
jgi:biopolymer transport protein ExbD